MWACGNLQQVGLCIPVHFHNNGKTGNRLSVLGCLGWSWGVGEGRGTKDSEINEDVFISSEGRSLHVVGNLLNSPKTLENQL